MQHLWDFSHLPDGLLDGGSLEPISSHVSSVFTEDSRVSEAANWVQKMLPLTEELHMSNVRLGLTSSELDGAPHGTIEAALRNLRKYRAHLTLHLVQRFMMASRLEGKRTSLTVRAVASDFVSADVSFGSPRNTLILFYDK